MKIPKAAIEKAMAGGWKPSLVPRATLIRKVMPVEAHETDVSTCAELWAFVFVDPEFWKCLGKSCGWEESIEIFMSDYTGNHPFMGGTLDYPYVEGAGMTYKGLRWKYEAMRFFDLILIGGDTDAYWQEILK